MLSDLVAQIAYAKKELAAIKAGFTGDETRFDTATVTTQVFSGVNSTHANVIRVDFPYQDFPQFYVEGSDSFPAIYHDLGIRKNLYEFFIPKLLGSSASLTVTLISQYTPTVFVVEAAT